MLEAMAFSRRDLLRASLASLAVPALAVAEAAKPRPLRVLHMTDFHVQPEMGAAAGMRMALDHAMALRPKPDLLLMGGDLIMDAFAQTEARTRTQWDLYANLIKDHTEGPVHHCLGNHDVWGWNKKDSATTGGERRWGKQWFKEMFGYRETYHSFDLGPWHFVVLDNILLTPDGYNGFVNEEQLEWLDEDLGKSKRPTLILSHIPIFSITPLAGGYDAKTGEWNIGGNLMTKNEGKLRQIFAKHPQVKIALSGHLHLVDRVDYAGVSYLCGGAVCGAWWGGPNGGFEPGYRILDLEANGEFREHYVAWGWKPGLGDDLLVRGNVAQAASQ
jgi:3',5'-cyclic AMP phosphodiesterase CpdA